MRLFFSASWVWQRYPGREYDSPRIGALGGAI